MQTLCFNYAQIKKNFYPLKYDLSLRYIKRLINIVQPTKWYFINNLPIQ